MLTVPIGPLVLPAAPLLAMLALLITAWAVRRRAAAAEREAADTAVWWAAAAGLLGARLAHVAAHFKAYAAAPLLILDIRDGGFVAIVGLAVGLAVLWWRTGATLSESRRAVRWAAASGAGVWFLASNLLPALDPHAGQRLADLGVRLEPLTSDRSLIDAGPAAVDDRAAVVDPAAADAVTLQELAARAGGKPVVLNLWATWCGPCRAEMPMLAQAQREHPEVLFVFANQGETQAAILSYLQRERLDLAQVWRDPASALGPALGSRGLPTTVIFDAQGRRRAAHMGALNLAALQGLLQKAQTPP